MKIRPHKWTHHHTARTLHMSVFGTSLLVMVLILVELLSVIKSGSAQVVTDTDNTSLTAQVGDINEGPASGGGCCFIFPGNPTEPPFVPGSGLKVPTLTIQVDQKNISGTTTIKDGDTTITVPILNTRRPLFFGSTNILNAKLEFYLQSTPALYGTARADAEGKWEWRMPRELPNGNYTLLVTATDPAIPQITVTKSFLFIVGAVSPPPPSGPIPGPVTPAPKPGYFYMEIKVLDDFKTVGPGNRTAVSVKIKPLSPLSTPQHITISFIVENDELEAIKTGEESVDVPTEGIEFVKSFYTNNNTREGEYRIIGTFEINNTIISGQDKFTVQKLAPAPLTVGRSYFMIALILMLLLLICLLLILVEYRRIRKLNEEIRQLSPSPYFIS